MNFFPAGESGLPVSAPYLLAMQALPMGSRRSEGKMLTIHADNPRLLRAFVQRAWDDNRRLLDLAASDQVPALVDEDGVLTHEMPGGEDAKSKRPKYPDVKAPESFLIDRLIEVVGEVDHNFASSTTAYHISNSGQGPSLAVYHLPGEFVQFVSELHTADFRNRWDALVKRAWRENQKGPKPKKGESVKPAPKGPGRTRNELYADLIPVFSQGFVDWRAASRFIRRHLLCDPTVYYFDPQRVPHLAPRFGSDQLQFIDWKLTTLFVERVLGMDKKRIELIREFSDKLAELVYDHGDKALFRQLVFTTSEWGYRNILAKAQIQYARDRNKLALKFDEYINLFLDDNDEPKRNWSLIRDLISIRLVERLFELGFFDREENKDVLNDSVAAAEADE